MPNFFMPMVSPGQQGQRQGGMPSQQNQQQHVPLMRQQMVPRGRMYRYPHGRNVGEVPMGSIPYDIGNGMQLCEPEMAQLIPIGALASGLANASPTEQRTVSPFFFI